VSSYKKKSKHSKMNFFAQASENPTLLALMAPVCREIRSCSLLIEVKANITEKLMADLLHDLSMHYHVRVPSFRVQLHGIDSFVNRNIMD
jgi:hypothetical protein